MREAVCSAVGAGEWRVLKLGCADFVIFDKDGHSVGIERKEVGDLLNSLGTKLSSGNRRLEDQLGRMSDTYSHPILIVEGTWRYEPNLHTVGTSRRLTGWLASVVFLMLWNQQAKGVPLLPTADKWHTAEVLRILHMRAGRGCVLPRFLRSAVDAAA